MAEHSLSQNEKDLSKEELQQLMEKYDPESGGAKPDRMDEKDHFSACGFLLPFPNLFRDRRRTELTTSTLDPSRFCAGADLSSLSDLQESQKGRQGSDLGYLFICDRDLYRSVLVVLF